MELEQANARRPGYLSKRGFSLMNDLEKRILDQVRYKPGQKTREIASQLGVERHVVNSALYGRLKQEVRQDKGYRWYPNDVANSAGGQGNQRQLDTPLARLSRYYLDCLSHDDLGGVSEFASSKFGDLDYCELQTLPMFDTSGHNPFDSEPGRRLLGRISRDRNRKTIFLGYPVRLNLIRSRRGWEGFMVEPILLFPFQEVDGRYGGVPALTNDLPQLNFKALKALSNTAEGGLMLEAIQLADELGLASAADDQPDLDELIIRLQEIRSDWDWQERVDPYMLTAEVPLSDLSKQGIFNRAVLIAAERSPYTRGLESELGALQSVGQSRYGDTALGAWLTQTRIESPPADQQPLLEVLPLNSEQRQAVRQALSNKLTVITGPPGTGKSQIVTSILINAAWQGKTVLFASKNNKAVDVVETRVNALGPRPVLLRLGADQYRNQLAQYLLSLLAATATESDRDRYQEYEIIHYKLRQRSDSLDAELNAFVALRNELDQLEQRVENTRNVLGQKIFHNLRVLRRDELEREAARFGAALGRSDKSRQPLMTSLIWPFIRSSRFSLLWQEAQSFRHISEDMVLKMPQKEPDQQTIGNWLRYDHSLSERLMEIKAVLSYFEGLATLQKSPSLEDMGRQRRALTDELAENSHSLWEAWLQLQPSRLGPSHRKLLGDYSSLLQMIVSANEENQRLGSDVFRRYYRLFPQITPILPCWAVTSLSVRGRVPFEPSFFDLVVIDEASQCDIASALPLLYRSRKAVIIGDPMQLRHISALSKQQDQQLLSKHGLMEDRLGWAYSTRSLFDLASSRCNSQDIVALRDHHRSHADIIEFSNQTFYEGRLRIATRYDRLRMPHSKGPAIRWIDVQGNAVRPGAGGAVNEEEAQAVVTEIRRLVSQGYRGSVGVVTPFRAQANRIQDLASSHPDLSWRLLEMDFLASTADKFQGDERDVVFFSPVVSTGMSDGALHFLQGDPNRFNVAVTRARASLVIVGNKAFITGSNVDYLARLAAYVDQVGNRPEPSGAPDKLKFGSQYPPVSNPERVSEWERVFYGALYQAGIRPIPQYNVEQYALDFAVLSGERCLDVEVDGERYHRNWDGELCRRDQIRTQRLLELGWDVKRFWVYQIRDDIDHCVMRVRQWIDDPNPRN